MPTTATVPTEPAINQQLHGCSQDMSHRFGLTHISKFHVFSQCIRQTLAESGCKKQAPWEACPMHGAKPVCSCATRAQVRRLPLQSDAQPMTTIRCPQRTLPTRDLGPPSWPPITSLGQMSTTFAETHGVRALREKFNIRTCRGDQGE